MERSPLKEGTRLGEHFALLGILALALLLRLWNLRIDGWGSEYYSAAVRSMGVSAHNLLWDSFDPAGFITVDKPPVGLWLQCLSTSILGFNSFAILLPQILAGVAGIALLHGLARRYIGPREALLACAILTVNPVNVAVDRSSNLESVLTLLLLLAAAAFLRALQAGSLRRLSLAMVVIGLAFNVKFLAGWLLAPVFIGLYLLKAPLPRRVRTLHTLVAVAILTVVSLAWITAFDLQPANSRPYAAKTAGNSMYELAFGTYGAELIRGTGSAVSPPLNRDPARRPNPFFDDVNPGWPRLLDRHLAGQTSWLLPCALLGIALIVGLPGLGAAVRWAGALWVGWLVLYGAAFLFDGGTFHGYYLSVIGPPMAVLASIAILWAFRLGRSRTRWPLLLLIAMTAAWQLYIESEARGHFPGITLLIVLAPVAGMGALVSRERLRLVATGWALAFLMVAPSVWALSSVVVHRLNTLTPSADILRLAGVARDPLEFASSGYGVATDDPRLFSFLVGRQRSETFILATPNARLAAPIIIHTGRPVMALGGFSGEDPAMSPERLRELVREKRVRYILLEDDLAFGATAADARRSQQFLAVARQLGVRVDRRKWHTRRTPLKELLLGDEPLRLQGVHMQLYDLRPDTDEQD